MSVPGKGSCSVVFTAAPFRQGAVEESGIAHIMPQMRKAVRFEPPPQQDFVETEAQAAPEVAVPWVRVAET